MSEPPPGPYLLLVNPSAGGGRARELLPRASAALDAAGLEYRTVMTTGLEHGCDEATAAAAERDDPGGDQRRRADRRRSAARSPGPARPWA